MARITSRGTLITAIGEWLARSDLAARAESFIQMAEARLKRDERVRRLRVVTFPVSAATHALPDGFKRMEALVRSDTPGLPEPQNATLSDVYWARRNRGATGKPEVYAIADGEFHFGPEPDETISYELAYWETLTPVLSETVLSNWLLDKDPDIYLYSALVEAAPYIKDDPRLETWNAFRETALEELRLENQYAMYGGSLSRTPDAIG